MNGKLSLNPTSTSAIKPRIPNSVVARFRTQSVAHRALWTALGYFTIVAILLGVAQFATAGLVGNDGYYHIKLASLMRSQGVKPAFEWLPLTILNAQEFVDHHFLFHLLLIPFTFGGLISGAKVASVLFAALSFTAIWWLLRHQDVPYAFLWALGLLAISEAFLYRMNMPRAQSLSLAVLALALHWLLTEQHARLFVLAFLYVWLYNAFPLILVVTGCFFLASLLIERKLRWQPFVYAVLGIGLGLVINPYFPDNLVFIFRHIAPKLADPTATSVGNEWYPYNTAQLLRNSGGALALLVAGVLALGFRDRKMDSRTTVGLLLALLFGLMLLQSRRFVEYFPPFALIFTAFAWTPLIREWTSPAQPEPSLTQADKRSQFRNIVNRIGKGPIVIGLMILLLTPALIFNLKATSASVSKSKPHTVYAKASLWMIANAPAKARIFQTDWDDFPRLFFYNSRNSYTVGLDPTYMQLHDAELFDLWVDITRGKVKDPSEMIRETFGASYVVTDLKHKAFLERAAADAGLTEVYRDGDAAIFEVAGSTDP